VADGAWRGLLCAGGTVLERTTPDQRTCRSIATARATPIKVASIPVIAASIVQIALSDLPADQFPDHVHLRSTSAENVVLAIVARTADIGIPYRLRMRIDKALAEQSIETGGIIESDATYVSLALARSELGVAIVESVTLTGLSIKDVVILPLAFDIPFHWGVITATGVPLPATVEGRSCPSSAGRWTCRIFAGSKGYHLFRKLMLDFSTAPHRNRLPAGCRQWLIYPTWSLGDAPSSLLPLSLAPPPKTRSRASPLFRQGGCEIPSRSRADHQVFH
jgi:hypothetical protein